MTNINPDPIDAFRIEELRSLYAHLGRRLEDEQDNLFDAQCRLDNRYERERIGRIIASLETQRAETRARIESMGGDIFWHLSESRKEGKP